MHDPSTLAFSIPNPFAPRYEWADKWSQRPSLIDIWHEDPESDGSDDSCGYTYPTVDTDASWFRELRSDVAFVAGDLATQIEREGRQVWFWLWVERASWLHRRRPLGLRRFYRFIVGNSFPGLRDDYPMDLDPDRLAWVIARCYLRAIRPWWRHPRWHLWHWRVNVIPVLHFKRWAWSRCEGCGGRFSWGYAPVSNQWNGTGPSWFRGESGVRHRDCR